MSIEIKFALSGDAAKDPSQIIQARGVVALLSSVFGPSIFAAGPVTTAGTDTPVTAADVFAAGPEGDEAEDAGPVGDGAGLDANGLPWDERIHSSNRKKTAADVWYGRRGVSPATVKMVTAELRKTYPSPTEAPVPPVPAASTAPAPPPPVPTPAAASTDGDVEFPSFMKRISDAQRAGKATMADLNGRLVPEFASMFPQYGPLTGGLMDFGPGKPAGNSEARTMFLSINEIP